MAKRTKVDELIEELVRGKTPEEILGETGLVAELTKRLAETALNAELGDAPGLREALAGGT